MDAADSRRTETSGGGQTVRGRSRVLVVSILALGALWVPASAHAHPLGNFTINTSAALVVRAGDVLVEYVVDMAEIPAFQEHGRIDADADGVLSAEETIGYRGDACEELGSGLRLRLDRELAPLVTHSSDVSLPAGQAGLPTVRLTCLFRASLASGDTHDLVFEDSNYADRLGWREVTAGGDGATIIRSDVPTQSPSQGLRSYPRDVRPSDVRSAIVAFRPGGAPLGNRSGAQTTEPTSGGLLGGLASRPDLSTGLVALMIVVAIGVSAVHALDPGHGKSLIGAYMVGSGGTLRQAVAVGTAVSVMHTASVLGLGLLVISAERLFAPERVYPWLGLASGLVALGLGAALLISTPRALRAAPARARSPSPGTAPLPPRTDRTGVRRWDPSVAERAGSPPRFRVDLQNCPGSS